jgi:hypothetical protein
MSGNLAGVQKAATSTLHALLAKHLDSAAAQTKGGSLLRQGDGRLGGAEPAIASSAIDAGWSRPERPAFNPIDYFICRCIRFPPFVVRDGRAAVLAQMARDNVTAEVAVASWMFAIHVLQRAVYFAKRVLVVRVEDMRSDPKHSMVEICNFLGVPYAESMTENLVSETTRKLLDNSILAK